MRHQVQPNPPLELVGRTTAVHGVLRLQVLRRFLGTGFDSASDRQRKLVGHDVKTTPEMGWASKRNGELLGLAVSRFDVFLTADGNLSYQQDVSAFDIAVVVLAARSNRLEDHQLQEGDEGVGAIRNPR
jgi:hypothetical protein